MPNGGAQPQQPLPGYQGQPLQRPSGPYPQTPRQTVPGQHIQYTSPRHLSPRHLSPQQMQQMVPGLSPGKPGTMHPQIPGSPRQMMPHGTPQTVQHGNMMHAASHGAMQHPMRPPISSSEAPMYFGHDQVDSGKCESSKIGMLLLSHLSNHF